MNFRIIRFVKTQNLASLLCFFILFIISTSIVCAQQGSFDINALDLSKTNVDQLTDDQIRQLVERAEANGITMQMIEATALSRGMSQADVQKLLRRMNTVKTLGTSGARGTDISRTREKGTDPKREDLKPENILSILQEGVSDSLLIPEDPRAKIFGYSLFNTTNLTFEPSVNMPTPAGYVLGPGDEVIIDVWGASQNNYSLIISPEGNIFIDKIGSVFVSGLTIEQATARIKTRLSAIYSGLRGAGPNTFMQVSVGALRSIKVILLGEVYLPGSYTLNSLATAFNALYLSGGPGLNGSMREIKLIRDNKIIETIDVYDLLFNGSTKNNVRLNDQDIIRIDPYSIRVKINGQVKRPLIYEMKETEKLADLIRFSGGFHENAYTHRLKVYRNTTREKKILDIPHEEFTSFSLQNGDSVVIESVLDRFENRVEIKGAVYRPGFYSLGDSLTLLKLLEKAEGLKGDAFSSRASIYRTMEDYNIESIPVDLQALLTGSAPDIPLKREDIVLIPSIFDLKEEYYVQIDGEVRYPGRYPFMYNSTVEDIIVQAGGLLESASMAHLEVARRVRNVDAVSTTNKVADIFHYSISKDLRISPEGKNLTLEPFDRIFIRRSPGYEEQLTVKIEGEVLFPGEYSISNKDERISDMINRSGGLTPEAYPKGGSLIRVFSIDEKERTKAIQSGRLFRENYLYTPADQGNITGAATGITRPLDDKMVQMMDSIITSATRFADEQSIGIDLEKILANPYSKFDLILQEGDRLIVPKLLQTVSLRGELLHPITARYDRRDHFKSYVRSAGGFTSNANKSKSYVIYANGSVDVTRSFIGIKKYPKIEPGAEIVVPLKERRTMSPGEIVSLGSAMTSMALLVVTLLNNLR